MFFISEKKLIMVVCLLLTVTAITAFWQINRCDFINYDDPTYVTDNAHIRYGVTINAIRWAFTTGCAANWHPLTWMSHMLDIQLFGLNPGPHHFTNLLFHIANTLLLFLVFYRMTKAPWKSAITAALFGVHPLHVESVAWIAERKDVLSAFFWMLTMAAYIHYVKHLGKVQRNLDTGRRTQDRVSTSALRPSFSDFRYWSVILLFTLGLLAKPMLVTLPCVLLLMDFWPLGRLGGNIPQISRSSEADFQFSSFRSLVLEKVPLFALAALSCIVTYIAQQKGGAVKSVQVFPVVDRIANALVSYAVYIKKTVWPEGLAVFYPHPGSWPLLYVLGAGFLLMAATATAILAAKRFPYLTVGWLWFTGMLVPVIGIVQVGNQSMADRYTYVPLIGLFIMAAWGIPEFLKNSRYRNVVFSCLSSLALICLLVLTWKQTGYWRNSITLYDHSLDVTGDNATMLNNRGAAYVELGSLRRGVWDYDNAVKINPDYAEAYNNRGIAYARLGDQRQAIEDFGRAVKILPGYAEAYNNRGVSYGMIGDDGHAIADYDTAIEIDPENAAIFNNRGIAYGKLGNHRRAIEDFDTAIGIDPTKADVYFNRGVAYIKLADSRKAIADFQKAALSGDENARNYLRKKGISW